MEPLIQLKNVIKKYDRIVLNNINFKIYPGEKIAIIGANGGGKTTISEIITGIRIPSKGQVIKNDNLILGIQFQQSKYPTGINVLDMIKYYLQTFNIEMNYGDLESLLETYQLKKFSKKFVSELSIGDQQRLNILLAVIHKPDLVVLDEISTGLDIQIREDIFQFLQKNIMTKNIAVILVTHQMEEVERFCERLIFLHQGEIIEKRIVKDVVKEYGSVKKYTEFMLNKYKGEDLEQKIKTSPAPSKLDFINHKKKHPQKGLALWKVILKYYGRGVFVPMFLILYPIFSMLLLGHAYKSVNIDALKSIIQGITVVQIISIGIFVMPETIIDFKNSVILKRIGATRIKSSVFILSLAILGFLFGLFSYFWSIMWAGIFFGQEYGWDNLLELGRLFQALPLLIILLVSSSGFGLMLTLFFKSSASFIAASNFAFVIISFLSGGYTPFDTLEADAVLKIIVYFNPFYYITSLYFSALRGVFVFDLRTWIFIIISISLLFFYTFMGAKNLRWQA